MSSSVIGLERFLSRGKVLHQVCVKIVADPPRKQTFTVLGDGAKHVFGYLLVCLHGHCIRMAIGASTGLAIVAWKLRSKG
jgi:hypothetical protein